MTRGEIWMFGFPAPDKARPVLVLTRADMIGVLNTVTVAPLTRTRRGVPSEVKCRTRMWPEGTLGGERSQPRDHSAVWPSSVRRHRSARRPLPRSSGAAVCVGVRAVVGDNRSRVDAGVAMARPLASTNSHVRMAKRRDRTRFLLEPMEAIDVG